MDFDKLKRLKSQWWNGPASQSLSIRKERNQSFRTTFGVPLNPLYTPLDLKEIGFDYERDGGFPGQYPFTRGKEALGYRNNLWIFQQYAGFGDAEVANKRYRYLLDHGQTGISIALDLPTQIGLDSDDVRAEGEVGKIGVAIDSLADFEILFHQIPLNKPRQISFVANAVALIGLAMFIALAEKQRIPTDEVVVRIQNDILKEFIARGTYIYPPGPSVRLATDLIKYCVENHPHWRPLTVCGYHIRESGANAAQEVAFSLANALEYLDSVHESGLEMEKVLPTLSAFMSVDMDFFEEIAKMRALRRVWARLFKDRYSINDTSKLNFDLVAFTAGSSLTAQQAMNNIVRVSIECLAAVLGGCQSLFPCSMDEAYCTPSEESVKVALRTQQIIAYETDATATVDPLGGSYFIESLTSAMENKVFGLLKEVEKTGGAIAAVNSNFFQKEIEEAAFQQQKEVESGNKIVVGVNRFSEEEKLSFGKFRPPKDTAIKQKSRLEEIRRTRDNEKVQAVLKQIEKVSQTDENLVPILVEAVKAYATIGEICDVFRRVFSEYRETY
jgi:methylmalonyl-CoA mutase N-terminal domain/subunit